MTTQDMLHALTTSLNNNTRKIATDILDGTDTIENQKTICGKFMQKVFEGDYQHAFRVADTLNKHAFIRYLIEIGDDKKATDLIHQTGFNYGED